MPRFLHLIILSLLPMCFCLETHAQVVIKPGTFDFGTVDIASSMSAAYTFTNNTPVNVYLLKVEAPDGVTYNKPMHAVTQGNTDTLRVMYSPEKAGSFNEAIKLYFSNDPRPVIVHMKGSLKTLDKTDLDCPTFNDKPMTVNVTLCDVTFDVINADTKQPIANAAITNMFNNAPRFTVQTNARGSYSMSVKPDVYAYRISADGFQTEQSRQTINRRTQRVVFELKPAVDTGIKLPTKSDSVDVSNANELSVKDYAFNNIVFLIDVSSSMNMNDKMPLLKKSMSELIRHLRNGDRVAIVTYADKAIVVRPSAPVTDKAELQRIVEQLQPNGGTSANKGLATAHDVLAENYLPNGNNQLVLATDGSFTLKETDLQLFNHGYLGNGRPVRICIVGFGKDKTGLKSLRKTAQRFDARYLYIDKSDTAEQALLDEVKNNSRK